MVKKYLDVNFSKLALVCKMENSGDWYAMTSQLFCLFALLFNGPVNHNGHVETIS